jgi:endonuclease/exonuclease/phosphatase family metal-dependent hydrolase
MNTKLILEYAKKTHWGVDYIVHAYKTVRDNLVYRFKKVKKLKSKPYNFNLICSNLRRDVLTDGKNSWQNRKNTYLEFVKKEKPSILCMQEVMPHMARFLISNLNDKYDFYGTERYSGMQLNKTINTTGEGLAIMYDRDRYTCFDKGTFWLSLTPNKSSVLWDVVNDKRICVYVGLHDKTTKESFYVFNGHFHHEADELLKLSVDFTVSKIKQITGGLNSFFCADLNDYWNSSNMLSLDEYYEKKTGDCGYTFNSFNTPFKTIDAIYYNGEYKVKLYNDDYGKPLSDHYPLGISN